MIVKRVPCDMLQGGTCSASVGAEVAAVLQQNVFGKVGFPSKRRNGVSEERIFAECGRAGELR